MGVHHRLSPSAREIWGHCSGQVRLLEELDLPLEPPRFESVQGTVAHLVLAQTLEAVSVKRLAALHEWADDPSATLRELDRRTGEVISQDGLDITVDAEMVACVGAVVLYVAETLLEARTGAELYVEQSVCFERKKGWPSGTADILILSADRQSLWVIDFKYGQGIDVVPRGNLQLQTYALAAVETLLAHLVDTVHLVIHQPRKGGIKTSTHTWDECRVWWDTLEQHVAAVDSVAGSRSLSVGSWCRWCRCKPQCPAHRGLTQQVIQQVGAPSWDITSLTDAELGERLTVAKAVLAPLIKEIDAEVSRRLHEGGKVPGYKLVAGRGSRQWNDEEEVLRYLMGECDLGREDVCRSELRSPAQIEKLTKEKGWLVPLKTLQSAFIESVPSKNKLVVPDEDSRPAAVVVTGGDALPADVTAKLRAEAAKVMAD